MQKWQHEKRKDKIIILIHKFQKKKKVRVLSSGITIGNLDDWKVIKDGKKKVNISQ